VAGLHISANMKINTVAGRRNPAPQQSVHSRNLPRRNDGKG